MALIGPQWKPAGQKRTGPESPAQVERREGTGRSVGKLISIDGWPSRIERRERQRKQIQAPDSVRIEAGGVRAHRAEREADMFEDYEQFRSHRFRAFPAILGAGQADSPVAFVRGLAFSDI